MDAGYSVCVYILDKNAIFSVSATKHLKTTRPRGQAVRGRGHNSYEAEAEAEAEAAASSHEAKAEASTRA